MLNTLQQLLLLLDVKKIANLTYLGENQDMGLKQTFGGLLVSQSVSVACQAAPVEFKLHSLHSYFLLPGDNHSPIRYQITPLKLGKSFCCYQISAYQHNQMIFQLMASFQQPEIGTDHQLPMPDVLSYEHLIAKSILSAKDITLPAKIKIRFSKQPVIEVRVIEQAERTKKYLWFKASEALPTTHSLHQIVLSYFSDFYLLPTALQFLNLDLFDPNNQVASLDHSIWFHRPVDLNMWSLYATEVINISGNRALIKGEIYNQQKKLTATCVQEGLVRHNQ